MQDSYTEFENTPAAFKMILVEGDVFDMGSDDEEAEKPIHKVRVSSFWMGKFAVTQALWTYVMKENPSDFKGTNRPVENVSYEDIVKEFLPKLNIMTGQVYRLPTEAEWEYAAKGGKYGQKYPFEYAGSNKLEEVGWYDENSHNKMQKVGLKTPNLLDLYDMSGNVSEWCSDWYDKDFYKTSTADVSDNPIGPDRVMFRVLRGGSWDFDVLFCRSSYRNFNSPKLRYHSVGFRLVLSFSPVQ
jgi:sulfatase modifying factor 1